jgi:hypothetical protein
MPTVGKKQAPFWSVDCESDPFAYGRIPEPFLWGVYDGGSGAYWEFDTVLQVVTHLRAHDVLAYAHNGGKFDWHFLSAHFEPEQPLLVINGRLARFKIGRCEFRDSYTLMPIALKQYQKTDIEYWKLEKAVRHQHMDEIRAYLKSDCVNLWNLVNGFEQEFGRHLTQASAAMRIWQRRSKRQAPRSGVAHYEQFKPFYYGGRVQCFQAGDFSVKAESVDIRSAYPAAMLHPHPISLDFLQGTGDPDFHPVEYGPCFFSIRCVARGAFPYRALNKMLYFPSDDVERIYHVTGWELQAALETNTVENLEILSWTRFNECIDFKDYVEYFWNERKKAKAAGDKGRDHYCKIFLNGLYGKFAADPREYNDYVLRPVSDLASVVENSQDFSFFREWLLVINQAKKERYYFYNIATAASITGLVRANLWRAILKTDTPFYCDTDSVTGLGFKNLDMGDELGQFGLEGQYDRVIVCGKKLYAFHKVGRPWEDSLEIGQKNWKKATKGARLTAQELATIAGGQDVEFRPEVPTFSVRTNQPRFTKRVLRITAADVTKVPIQFDPMFATAGIVE